MISNELFREYTTIMSSDEDPDAIHHAITEMVKCEDKIIPKILPLIQDSKQPWNLRYNLLKVLHQIGITDVAIFDTLKALQQKEKDTSITKKILDVLSEAQIRKVAKCYPENPELLAEVDIWQEICNFEEEEIQDIENYLREAKIPHAEILLQRGIPQVASSFMEIYLLCVPQEHLMAAVQAIRSCMGMDDDWAFTGSCPGCQTYCVEKNECPECKLKLKMDPLLELVHHPFISFLYKKGLLTKELEKHPLRKQIEKRLKEITEE